MSWEIIVFKNTIKLKNLRTVQGTMLNINNLESQIKYWENKCENDGCLKNLLNINNDSSNKNSPVI